MQRVAIYHFTDKSEKRPAVYLKQLDELERFAVFLCPESELDVYCDMSLKTSEHVEFERLMANISDYEVLIAKDFYHINRKTTTFLGIAKDLFSRDTRIVTLENGEFDLSGNVSEESLRATVYSSQFNPAQRDSTELKREISSLFIKEKTKWILTKSYADKDECQKAENQTELRQLIMDKDMFDILVVNSLSDIHWNITGVVKIAEQIGKPIFSLQDGLFEIREGRS